MKDSQVLFWHSVAIQQDVFRTTPPGVSENNLEVPRDVDDGIFWCIDKPTVSGSASGQLARDAMTGIVRRVAAVVSDRSDGLGHPLYVNHGTAQ